MTRKLEDLKAAKGINGIAGLIGFAPKNLAYIVYGIPDEQKYKEFTVPKKSGGERLISSPIPKLKHVQSRLAEHLSGCLSEVELAEKVKPGCALSHGFKPDHSIITNAKNHVGRCWVFNVDLENFFPSINFGRVRGFFLKNRHFVLDPSSATLLAQIICHNNGLPQGSPTSPVISNLIASNLDISLNKLARRHRCTYTRYADDITFSTNRKEFSAEIALPVSDSKGAWVAGDELRYRIKKSGFLLNSSKTRMQFEWSRQDVTGLVVNDKVNVPREYIKNVRSKCDYYVRGVPVFKKGSIKGNIPDHPITAEHLRGMLGHILNIKGAELDYKRPKEWKDAPSYMKTHRRFLDYINFASHSSPKILCEGETDNIYVRSALRSLDKHYPTLISSDGTKNLGVTLFKYRRTTHIIQALNGGTGDFKDLIYSFHSRCKEFLTNKPAHPVILLVDNDQGSKGKNGVFAAAKNVSGLPHVDGSQAFYYLKDNLYLVPTPLLPPKTDTMIEDLLDASVKKNVLGRKTLNLDEKTFDPSQHYGKAIFAKNVVLKNEKTINFEGFRPLLDALAAVLDDYKARPWP